MKAQRQKRHISIDFDDGDNNNNNNNRHDAKRHKPPSNENEPDPFPTPSWEKYRRPALPKLDPKIEDVAFQQVQIDYIHGNRSPISDVPLKGAVPIVRMWGVTREGNSVQANVHGFLPYFYVKAPQGVSEPHLPLMKRALNVEMKRNKKTNDRDSDLMTDDPVVSLDMVRGNSIMGYSWGIKEDFIKVTLSTPKVVVSCRELLEGGISINGLWEHSFKSFESNIPYVHRFMIDIGVVGGGWVKIHGGKYAVIDRDDVMESTSQCQLEIDVDWQDVEAKEPEGEWSGHAPLRILSFDIECAGRRGVFPEPDKDPVINISNVVYVQGEPEGKHLVKNVFVANSCSKLPVGDAVCFPDEKAMLLEWKRFVREVDPDVIIGYNIANFDWPYLLNRAKALKLAEFPYVGRVTREKTWFQEKKFSSRANGTLMNKEIHLQGRTVIDPVQIIKKEHKLRSYTLNAVAFNFLKEQKDAVSHEMITPLWKGTDDDRRTVASYCLKDSLLALRLFQKLMMLYNSVAMARVTGIPIDWLMSKGQTVKVISQILRVASKRSVFVPFYQKPNDLEELAEEETYKGASVLNPVTGLHKTPVPTLDFASLYPSIMMAHNLCYTTVLTLQDVSRLTPDQYEHTPNGDYFLRREVQKGILPEILEVLLKNRKQTRDEQKLHGKESIKFAVLEGKQLALKISANSVYGFTGFAGKLPCFAISASVTAYGREMIEFTKKTVEETYCIANGHPFDAEVIYGDTDSVMIKTQYATVAEAIAFGKEAADLITKKFNTHPISLTFEKIYYPYLLISKKRYAGLYWTKPDTYDKLEAKGIESVRRDWCRLASNMVSTSLDIILKEKDVEKAKTYVKGVISDLLQDKVDTSLLVISKGLTKPADEYKNKQPHTELAEKMRQRDANSAPVTGDRVKYVMTTSYKKAKGYEKAEDPIYALENDVPIDHDYYLENQLKKPIMRLFSALMPDPSVLFTGDHTRKKTHNVPKTHALSAFTVTLPTCIGCKSVLRNGEKGLCESCEPNRHILYAEKMEDLRESEARTSWHRANCQRCQGNLMKEVKCSESDCHNFYARVRAGKDLQKTQSLIEKLGLDW
jgi:DNA polymerase delta subunit 1